MQFNNVSRPVKRNCKGHLEYGLALSKLSRQLYNLPGFLKGEVKWENMQFINHGREIASSAEGR